ncbi:flagellar hook-length control protein FliK [Oceanispirochaeta crateris]|uniref:Flagellar hook-length control protein FliK n=1 Tax=Oceanispirochaeta crateris TaxID=2518645 RepID=A0A5C1QKP2_9SPIO|nr:flagellar hook-length control protein FliK [Oceanispirochaeta crateris]QEN07888.1 flagellar hook-length control protein FliK [Oceanispirochaeta crateris]
MVQLSSPSADIIPVKQGKSPDKAPGLKNKSDGFKTALNKQKENHDTESVQKTAMTADPNKTELATLVNDKRNIRVSLKLADTFTEKKGLVQNLGVVVKDLDIKGGDEKKLTLSKSQKKTVLPDIQVVSNQNTQQEAKGLIPVAVESEKEIEKSEKLSLNKGIPEEEILQNDTGISGESIGIVKSSETSQLVAQNDVKSAVEKKDSSLLKAKTKMAAEETKITVEDRRTVSTVDKSASLLKVVESPGPDNQMTMELVPSDDAATGMAQADQMDTSGKTFSLQTAEEQKGAVLLDKQLQDKGTQELTKNIRFVLKDNKEGEIKLILKPESLGKVRINLNLHENNIVGKIIVENNSVRQAFMNNLADLTKALEDSGFSSASLDVSVGGGQADGRQQHKNEKPVYFTNSVLDDMDGQIPVVYEEGMSLSQINLVV